LQLLQYLFFQRPDKYFDGPAACQSDIPGGLIGYAKVQELRFAGMQYFDCSFNHSAFHASPADRTGHFSTGSDRHFGACLAR
jgi:hypothetical protein